MSDNTLADLANLLELYVLSPLRTIIIWPSPQMCHYSTDCITVYPASLQTTSVPEKIVPCPIWENVWTNTTFSSLFQQNAAAHFLMLPGYPQTTQLHTCTCNLLHIWVFLHTNAANHNGALVCRISHSMQNVTDEARWDVLRDIDTFTLKKNNFFFHWSLSTHIIDEARWDSLREIPTKIIKKNSPNASFY